MQTTKPFAMGSVSTGTRCIAQVPEPRKVTVTQKRQETIDKAEGLMSEAFECLEELWQELDEIRENMEEKFSQTERYQNLEQLVESLDTAKSELESAKDSLPLGNADITYHLCKRRATVGERNCFQHGGGRCFCPRYEYHSGPCRGPYCHCHG
jgi:uncharacterized protein YukE